MAPAISAASDATGATPCTRARNAPDEFGAIDRLGAKLMTLIGVMVAVALLPPLVTFGLLLGGGHPDLAMGALSLFLVNLICVNLAGVATFLAQGIHPTSWWEKDRAVKATRVAATLWIFLLAALGGAVLLLRKG